MKTDVAAEEPAERLAEQQPTNRSGVSTRVAILLVVAALFAGVLAAKFWTSMQRSDGNDRSGAVSVTSVPNDASVDYEAAIRTGKPIYVLFHSLN
jgi:Na+-transporting methylmalonyl-CoA/oxaloacetate decarboxylase beta subunit